MDAWDTKCLRGSAGSVFNTPITKSVDWTELYQLLSEYKDSTIVYIADNNTSKYKAEDIVSYENVQIAENVFVIIGGETHGISQEALRYLNYFYSL